MSKKKVFFLFLFAALLFVPCFKFVKKSLKMTDKQPYLTVLGPVLMTDGLGRHSAELIDALKNEMEIGFKATGPFFLKETPLDIRKILKRKAPLGKVLVYQDYLVVNGQPLSGSLQTLKNKDHIRIAQSMFESSAIPPEWVIVLNHYFDAVFVPDKFLVEVYKNSGVTIPVFELPLALNLEKFYKIPLKMAKNSPVVFANLSTAIPRKNQVKLIQAFHKAFGNSPEVKLRLNSRQGEPFYSQAIKNEIYRLGATNIEFTEIVLPDELYLKTFQNIDCYVNVSTGEGFSIQPREAMALGIPVIITDNTGQSTICSTSLVRKIPSLVKTPAFYPTYSNYYGYSYDCELEDIVSALKDVYDNYDYYLQQGPAAREWAKQCSFEHLRSLYLGLIKPKKMILGSINKITPDCLFTDSQELCEKFNQLVGVPFEHEQSSQTDNLLNEIKN